MSKIGLALGGGGAKGFAHIGVLRALEALNIRPDLIAGTSSGGIISAMVAAGLSVDQIEAGIRAAGLMVLAAREPSGLGLLGRDKFARWLEGALGNVTFDRLSLKLAVVAVDLESESEVMLDSGRVVDALLATSAVPGVFAPVVRDGRYLVDGGVLNNVPFDVARRMGADQVIAVNVSANRGPLFQDAPVTGIPVESLVRQLLSHSRAVTVMTVLDRTIAIMQDGRLQDKLARCPPEVMLCPEVGAVGLFDLHHLDDCIEAGVVEVHAHEAELLTLHDKACKRRSWLDRFREGLIKTA